jgi:hypothetical protein
MEAPAVPGPARSPEPSRAPGFRPAAGTGRPVPRSSPRTPQRLTAIGSAVVTLAATFLGGAVDYWLFDGSGILMGLVYVAISFQVAVRVRPADLAAAPISGPIAFAVTLGALGTGPSSGLVGQLIGLATSLALQAGWLFAGTALSVVITLARHFALTRARRRSS